MKWHSAAAATVSHSVPRGEAVYDRRWAGDARWAVTGALAFLTLTTLADRIAGTLTWWRFALWTALAAMLLYMLLPPRVTAGRGWLAVRGLWGERLIRTDALVSVECSGRIAEYLVLRDAYGEWASIDLRTITGSPLLWHRLDADARRAAELGWLPEGNSALRELSDRIDATAAQAVFRASQLE